MPNPTSSTASSPHATKAERLDGALASIEKGHGKGAIMRLGESPGEDIQALPSGSIALDAALGIGGYPRGRIVEIFGPESSGKTTLTLHAIAEAQRAGGVAAFIDAEHAFDARYARAVGVDPARLLVSQPDCGEQALDIVDILLRSAAVDLIVIDSVAALVPRAEIDADMGTPHMGLHARLMSQALRKLAGTASRTSSTVIFINQLRQKIGVVFGNPEVTTGGNALKFYASVRLDVRRVGQVTASESAVGNRTRVRVVKNKCAPPFGEAELDIRWGIGIDRATDLLDMAELNGAVTKNGAFYGIDGKSFAQGREKARETLLADPALCSRIDAALTPKLPWRLAGHAANALAPSPERGGAASTPPDSSQPADKGVSAKPARRAA